MRRTDRIRHQLADELAKDPALRAETASIAEHGLRGKPSERYIEWKHEVNALADELSLPKPVMLERIIRQALRTLKRRQS